MDEYTTPSVTNNLSNDNDQIKECQPTDDQVHIGNLSKNDVGLLKNREEVFAQGVHAGGNITFNFISGDSVTGNGQKIDFGEDNEFGNVTIGRSIGSPNNDSVDKTSRQNASIDLADYSVLYRYLKEQQQSPYCSLLIVMAIFENCQFDLVCEEAKILYEMLSEEWHEIINDKGEKITIKREIFEISRQETISYFAIRFYEDNLITLGGKVLTNFVAFLSDEHSINILRCVYSEFMVLRDKITKYLIWLVCSEKIVLYSSAVNSLKKLCIINPEYFISKVVVELLENKTIPADLAVAEMLCSIAEHSKSANSADRYLGFISNMNRDIHYYIITLLMCKSLSYKRDKISALIRPIIRELMAQPGLTFVLKQVHLELPEEEDYINNVDVFFNIGNRYAEYYIALINELYDITSNIRRTDARRNLIQIITLLFIREDFNESCLNTHNPKKFNDMIFIRLVLRDDRTRRNLLFLWGELLRNARIKNTANNYLEKYLSLRDGFVSDDIEYKKLEYFFVGLAENDKVRSNLIFFLKNVSTRKKRPISLAGRIYRKLEGIYNDG